MDRLLLLHSAPPPPGGSAILAAISGARRSRRRKRIIGRAAAKVLTVAFSLAPSLRRLLTPVLEPPLDLVLHGDGGGGGVPPISAAAGSGWWWRRPGSGRGRWNASAALLASLALASAIVRVVGKSPVNDLGTRFLVLAIRGFSVAYWQRWAGFTVLWIALDVLALRIFY